MSSESPAMTQVITEILNERRRQCEQEGWSTAHDDSHRNSELALAAAAYAAKSADDKPLQASVSVNFAGRWQPAGQFFLATMLWPWDARWWKPKDARANLVRAAALIVAEIERIDRSAARSAT